MQQVIIENFITGNKLTFTEKDFRNFILNYIEEVDDLNSSYEIYEYKNKYNYLKFMLLPYDNTYASKIGISANNQLENIYQQYFEFREFIKSINKDICKSKGLMTCYHKDLSFTNLGRISKSNPKSEIILIEGNSLSIRVKKDDLNKQIDQIMKWF